MDTKDLRTFWVLFQLNLLVDSLVRTMCRRFGLTRNEAAVLAVLTQGGPMEGSRVALFIASSRQNVQRTLEALAVRNYVSADRYTSGSQRVATWSVTSEGNNRFLRVRNEFSAVCWKLRQRLSRYDATIVNLEEMVEELTREKGYDEWTHLGLFDPVIPRRKLSVEPR